jgi:DNA-binding PadR family transcriptional regulator
MASSASTVSRLVVLWLLSEGPLHGYRIKKILEDQALSFWFPIEYASIYSVLRTLVKGGYVNVVAVERQGQRPERTRYAITRVGRDHLAHLLEDAWREPPHPSDSFQLALAARGELGEARIQSLIAERTAALRQRIDTLVRLAPSAPAPEMVERQLVLTRAELRWTQTMITPKGDTRNG